MSDAKVRCIIKRPDEEYGHVTNISTSLKNLQNIVEGYIEMVTLFDGLGGKKLVLICNEEGKLRDMPFNFIFRGATGGVDAIVGDAIIIGAEGEELCDVPISFSDWKEMLEAWGN